MWRRWRWYLRSNGSIDVSGPSERVEPPGAPVASTVAALNEATAVFDRVPLTPAALYRARSASWRWPE